MKNQINRQKIKSFTPKDGLNAKAHRKENNFLESYNIIVKTKKGLAEIGSLRIYGTKRKNYACFWLNDGQKGAFCSGSGSAGGYGYHRPSAAAADALKAAGIELLNPIDGRGDSAILEALEVLVKKLGYKTVLISKAHP